MPRVRLSNVQGNILKNFSKPNVRLIFFRFGNITTAKDWVGRIAKRIPSTRQLIEASIEFDRKIKRDVTYRPQETWLHVSLSANGIRKLGKRLPKFLHSSGFRLEMKSRAKILGDIGNNSPTKWIEPFKSTTIDGILIVASDQEDDADASTINLIVEATELGVTVVGLQKGQALKNEQGKHVEHFGFRDGVSQPQVAGIDGKNSKDLNQFFRPDEFVVAGLPNEWVNEGSFLVFRRLRQDVVGFWKSLRLESKKLRLTPEALAAKFVGRWDSGAPLAKYPKSDPNNPDESDRNDFDFKNDKLGIHTPRFSHIRKVHPRDIKENNKHRILRRGIPYGKPVGEEDPNMDKKLKDRGLLFMCYQKDIEAQFEFIQKNWANNPGFPNPDNGVQHGEDPIIGLPKGGTGTGFVNIIIDGKTTTIKGIEEWVTTTGGEYFFSPSLSALKDISNKRKNS